MVGHYWYTQGQDGIFLSLPMNIVLRLNPKNSEPTFATYLDSRSNINFLECEKQEVSLAYMAALDSVCPK